MSSINPFRAISLSFVLLILAVLGGMGAEPKRILLLHSFGREFEPFNTFSERMRAELAEASEEPLDFFDVALQSARFEESSQDGPFVDYLLALFNDRRLNLVVPIGGPAVRFAQAHRARLFLDVPMLITAVDERHLQKASLTSQDAVVAIRHNPPLLLENMLRLIPTTTNIVVVFGNSPLERFWVEEFRRESKSFTNRVGFTWLNQLAYDGIRAYVAAVPPHSAILYGQLTVDAGGIPHVEARALTELHALAKAPIFGVHDYQLGRGIVGGPLSSVRDLSTQAAAAAGRILRGATPGDIRPPAVGPGQPVYDWRELQRWGISEAHLPPGSLVRFREPTFWQRYTGRIVLVLAALLAQAAIISRLLIDRAKRRRAEQSLRESRNRLGAIPDTAEEGIITLGDNGVIESANAAALRLFGYTAEEMIGRNVSMLMPRAFQTEQDEHLATHQLTQQPRVIGQGREVSGRRKDGSLFPIDLAVSEVVLANRRILTGFVRDITDRKKAQQDAQEFGGRLMHAQEEERARLARELHDDITQRLARLAIDAGYIERSQTGSEFGETLREVRDGLVRLSEDVHSLSYRLHPALLKDLGLVAALKAESERFSQQESISVEANVDEVPENIPQECGLCLFRITQEALRNVARHAHTRAATVSLRTLDGGLQLAVADRGVGFDPGRVRQRPSLGLASMRERVRLLGGELDIESAPGHGTTIVAWIPIGKTDG